MCLTVSNDSLFREAENSEDEEDHSIQVHGVQDRLQ